MDQTSCQMGNNRSILLVTLKGPTKMLHVIATINRLRNESNVTPIHCNSSRLESPLVIYEFNEDKTEILTSDLITRHIHIDQCLNSQLNYKKM